MNIRRHKLGLLASILLVLSMLSVGAGRVALATQTAAGAATFHGDAARTGEQPGPAPKGEPSIAWQFATGDAVRSSPVIADDVLYIGSNDGFVYALDAATGTERWRFETGGRITGAASVADGSVYAGSADGYVYAIDAASGSQQWRFYAAELNLDVSRLRQSDRQRGMITSSVAVVDGLVFVTSNSFKVTALDAATGIEQWHTVAAGRDVTTPSVEGDRVFFASQEGIEAVDAGTGKSLWRAMVKAEDSGTTTSATGQDASETAVPTQQGDTAAPTEESTRAAAGAEDPGAQTTTADPLAGGELPLSEYIELGFKDIGNWNISAAPVVVGDQVYAVLFGTTASPDQADSGSGGSAERATVTSLVIALNRETGNVTGAQYFYAWKPIVVTPAVAGNALYIGGDQGILYAIDTEGSGELWGVQTEAFIGSSPAVADETVFFGNDDGVVFALAAKTGVEQWRFETGGVVRSSPLVADGLVYVGSDDGNVYAIGGS